MTGLTLRARQRSRIGLAAWVFSGLSVGWVFASCSSSNKGVDTLNNDQDGSLTPYMPDAGRPFEATITEPEASIEDAGADATGSCGDAGDAGRICGTRCVNTQTDPANCGNCSVVCSNTTPGTVCVQGHCQCPGDGGMQVCGNTCVDTTSDQTNCGFCGHNCQGNPCQAGLCQPNQIGKADMGAVVNDIAISSTDVFWTWTITGMVAGISRQAFGAGGMGMPQKFSVLNGDLRGVATDPNGQNVYWVDYPHGTVAYSSLMLTGFSPSYIIGGGDAGADGGDTTSLPTDVVVDGKNAYWVDDGTGTVNQAALPQGGSAPGKALTLATGQSHPNAIAVDANYVYWTNHGTTQTGTGSVNRIPINATCGNNCVLQLATMQDQPKDIAVDATNVYWTSQSNSGSVSKATTGGGQLTVLAQNLGSPSGIAVDTPATLSDPKAERFVYWTNYNDNTVLKLSLTVTSTTPYPLASQPGKSPLAIAIDQKNVYWADQVDGTIWKVAK